ncbi:hypothetical protein ACOSQ3_002430 [Xanthoceras sorbifolium]
MIWRVRNLRMYGKPLMFDSDVWERASDYLNEVVVAGLKGYSARALVGPCSAGSYATTSLLSSGKIWKLPDIGFKIKVDAALDLRGNAFGIGVVIRNTFGVVVCVVSQFFECLFDVEVAEAQRIIAGISLTVGRGLSPCVIESDAPMLCSCGEGLLFPDERLTIRFWTSSFC